MTPSNKAALISLLFILSAALNIDAKDPLNKAKLDSLISALEKYDKAMGTLTISEKGKVLYNKSWGFRNITEKKKLPSDINTKYRIGSITKMFTSVMILQLAEEGKLGLDQKLDKYYPQIPNAENITIEMLLRHRSGLYNFTDDSLYENIRKKPATKAEMLSLFSKQKPSFDPEEKGEYSNTNFVLLGFIIEDITHKSFAKNLKNRITKKLKLKNTYYGSAARNEKNEALSFVYNGENWEAEPETDMSVTSGAGALVSTTNDIARFAEALFSGRLLKNATVEKMLTMKDNFGLGIFQFPFDEKRAYGHTGGIDGFHSLVGYFPEDSVVFAYTGNGESIQMNDIAIAVMSIYFQRPYHIPDYSIKEINIAAEELSKYEGIYSSKEFPLKITIRKEADHLTAQATGQGAFPLTAISEKEFKFDTAQVHLVFELKEKETIRQFTLRQNGGHFIFVKE
jgi:D-alanyl-D-alanine carboxypeptidase